MKTGYGDVVCAVFFLPTATDVDEKAKMNVCFCAAVGNVF